MTTAVDLPPPSQTALLFTATIGEQGDRECVSQLSEAQESNVLFISYDQSPDELLNLWRSRIGDHPAEFGVIRVGDDPGDTDTLQSETDRNVVSLARPDCLGRLQTTILLYLDQWTASDRPTTLCFDSVTSLLRHVDRATAFRFLRTLVKTLRTLDVSAHFHMHPDAHDEETRTLFRSLFDAVVGGPPETDPPISPAVISTLLGSRRRRFVCRALADDPDRTDVSAIAEQIAAWESAGTPSSDSQDRVHITLRHVHLPKLVEAGIVECDGDNVTATVGTDELERYVRLTDGEGVAEAEPPLPSREELSPTKPPRDDSDEAYWTVYGTARDSVVVTLARALGAVFDVHAAELRPVLYDVVDVDALQRLAEREGTSVYATFRYEDYEVVVDGGEIRLYESG